MPLRAMRPSSSGEPLGQSTDEVLEDGDEDADPLLPSDGSGLDRVRAKIEHELASSGGDADSSYDRMFFFQISSFVIHVYLS